MKKSLLLILLMALFAPLAMNAQETVTVCNGTTTNQKIPVNGLYADTEGTTSEFIIPATVDNMDVLVGASITGMTFYINTTTATWGQTTIEVYMGEVEYTTLSSLQGPDNFTVVSTQDWDNTGLTIELVFDVPYVYEGGNLLIGTRVTACDNGYKSTPFVGTEGAAGCSRYNNGSGSGSSQSFLPKTTFTYELAPQGDCVKPETVTASNVEAHSASLSWEGGSTPGNGYNVELKGGQYDDWTRIYSNISQGCVFTQLLDNTSYQARVQVVCSAPNEEEDASGWTVGRFTTPIACPAPTGLVVTLTPGDGTVAEFSWTENGEATSWQLCLDGNENDLIDMDENPFTYDQFTPEQTYTAKVRAYCNDIDQSEWSNTVTFTPTDAYSITVNDGSNTNGFVPVYGYYVDATSMSQFIIPATDLEDIQWGTINSLTFYASELNVAWAGTDYYGNYQEAAFEVYMAEVDYTTFTNGTPVWDGMQKVMNASLLGISDHQMVVTLDLPYQYMGGNLMIGIKQTVSGKYGTSTWYGVTQTENTAIGNKSNSGTAQELKQFLPKTTFSYIPGEEPDCITPLGLAVSSITNESAVATWNAGEAVSWNLQYRMQGENEWITENDLEEASYPFENLEAATTYEVQVQANCGDALSEYSTMINFTTDLCAAEDKCYVTLELTDAYGDGWGGATLDVVDAETNIIIGTYTLADGDSETYTVYVCPDRTINFVYTPGNWAYENGYVFTDINNEVIASHEGCATQGSCDAPTTGVVASYLVNCRVATCAQPAGLTVTPYGSYAEVTWEAGEARSWEVCVDDDEDNIIEVSENSYTIEHLEFSSDHTVRVRAYCGENDGYSTWTQNMGFTTLACDDACSISYVLTANAYEGSYSYGWYYSGIKVLDATTGDQIDFWTVDAGNATSEGTLTLCPDTRVTFEWYCYYSAGNDNILVGSYAIYDHLGDVITEGSGPMSASVNYTMDCTVPDCMWPTNITVEPSYTSATISWDGEETNTYNVQYRTAPVIFYDGFEYGLDNWTILVQGEVPSSGDFVNGWATYGEASHSGNKTAASRSWANQVALAADNWLITPQLELQGTLKFWVMCSYPSDADEYEVLLSTGSNAVRDFTVTLQDATAATGEWEPIEIDLSRYAGNRGYIAIRHHFTNGELLFVDDFGVYGPEENAGRWKDARVTGTSIELEDLDMDTFYEYLIQNDCGDTQSDWKGGMFQTLNGNEKTFNNDGYWNVDANWIPEGVPTSNQNVTINAVATIPSGCIATPNNITVGENGAIIIEDGGQLLNYNEVEVTIQKEIAGYGDATNSGWYLISASVWEAQEPSVENGIINEGNDGKYYDLFGFDGTSVETEWQNYKDHGFDMQRGYGYMYANHDDATLEFTGNLVSLDGMYYAQGSSITLDYDESAPYGTLNLAGNIFATYAELYLYDGTNMVPVTNLYKIYETAEGSKIMLADEAMLAPNEGAFIEATDSGLVLIIGPAEVDGSKASSAMLNIALLSNGSKVDMARVRFGEGNNLTKFQFNANDSKVYIPQNDKDYAVVYGEATGEMPLNFKAEKIGTYTISFKAIAMQFGYLHLFDKVTGNDVDLNVNNEYTFIGSPRDMEDRFIIRFSETAATDDMFAYQNGDEIIVNGEGTLQVYDVMGRFVASYEVNGNKRISADQFSNAVYIFRMIGNEIKTQKIVVR